MNRKGKVFFGKIEAGVITEDENGYHFQYLPDYLNLPDARPVSFTLPLQEEAVSAKTMLPFFDGLIPEGWLLEAAVESWKLDPRDRMGLLLSCCKDCIGAVSVIPMEGSGDE